MFPELFSIELFGREFPLRTFGPIVAIGFLIGVWWGTRLSRRYGGDPVADPRRAPDVAWWILIGVVAGGRLAYVLVNLPDYLHRPLAIFAIWEGGLVMYGGLILAVLLGAWKLRQLGMDVWMTADYGLTAGFLGQAIGRLGCLAVGDDYGRPTDVPWALRVPDPLPEHSLFPEFLAGCTIHPTQIYMSLKALALFLLGMWLLRRRAFKGQVFCALLAGYAVLRFIIEIFRFDAEARSGLFRAGMSPEEVRARLQEQGIADAFGGIVDMERYRQLVCSGAPGFTPELLLSTSQIISLVLLPAALVLCWKLSRRPEGRLHPR
ncbi:MAG: prolipoprotein diacylglyceryl transferase [Planctomycetota bacterium]|nr:MAG: prolipoprotein diacylglyceryl transferase [Planctomycetota bacterium]